MKAKWICGLLAASVIGIANTMVVSNASANPEDAQFIGDFFNVSLEIQQIGRMAQAQSQNDQVIALGQQLVQDYAIVDQQLVVSAQVVGLTPQLTESGAKEITKLESLSGLEFDKEAVSELLKQEKLLAHQLELEAHASGSVVLRQMALILQAGLQPDLLRTEQLDAALNEQS